MPRYNVDRRLQWWNPDIDPVGVHESVYSAFERLDHLQRYRQEQNLHHLRLYSNRLSLGLAFSDYATADVGEKIKINVVKSVVDTATAHIASIRPKPMFLTKDGDYRLQRKAQNLTNFCSGVFYKEEHYHKALEIFKDACIFGTGFLKVFPMEGEVHAERVFPDEVITDDNESKYGYPRTMYQHKTINREVLAEIFPDAADNIMRAKFIRDNVQEPEGVADVLSVVEAWHLPSGENAKDGRHSIVISNQTLVDEEWTKPFFPIIDFQWSPAPIGYYGIGLAEELNSIQVEINYLAQKIQRLMTLATSQIWMMKGSQVNQSSMNNEDWSINTYTGQPPTFMNPQSVSSEYFMHIDRLIGRAYEIAGVAQMNASGVVPRGLESGRAIRAYSEQTSKRFLHVQQMWERFHMRAAKLYIDAAADLQQYGEGGYTVLSKTEKGLEEINFKDASMDKNVYQLQVFPTSFLPDTPAGKLETIKELGEIDPRIQQQMLSLLEFPDLERATNLINAPLKLCDRLIEDMLEKGIYRAPEPGWDLQMCVDRMNLQIIEAQNSGYPEERIELLRDFIAESDAMMAQAQQPAPVAPGVPTPPGAVPQPPPVQAAPGAPPVPQEVAGQMPPTLPQ